MGILLTWSLYEKEIDLTHSWHTLEGCELTCIELTSVCIQEVFHVLLIFIRGLLEYTVTFHLFILFDCSPWNQGRIENILTTWIKLRTFYSSKFPNSSTHTIEKVYINRIRLSLINKWLRSVARIYLQLNKSFIQGPLLMDNRHEHRRGLLDFF